MAKKLIKKRGTVSKDALSNMVSGQLKKGKGRSAIIPNNIDEQYKKDPKKVAQEFSQNFAMVPLKQVEPNPDQPRKEFDADGLKELSESIKVHGIIQPITVRRMAPNEYQLISGERRWRASKLAGLTEVPAYIRFADDQTLMEMALIENIQRQDLSPIEIAISYRRLKDEFNLTDSELAERVGKKRSTITNYRNLLNLHIEVIEALKISKIGMGHGRALQGLKDQLQQKVVLDEILAKKLSVRDTETLVSEFNKSTKKAPAKPKNKKLTYDHERILEDFQTFFGSKRIKMELEDQSQGKGKITIPFDDNDQ